MTHDSLRLGRISPEIEEATGLSLTSDPSVYVSGETLDKMATAHPSDYLALLDRCRKLLLSPDFARSSPEGTRIDLVRMRFRGEAFEPLSLTIEQKGTPQKWYLCSLCLLSQNDVRSLGRSKPFCRVTPKKKTSRARRRAAS